MGKPFFKTLKLKISKALAFINFENKNLEINNSDTQYFKVNKLKSIIFTTKDITKINHSLWLLFTYHIQYLSTEELFSFINLSRQVDEPNKKYFGVRKKLEKEIVKRQETKTILLLLELLKNEDLNLRSFGLDLLNHFNGEIVIEPLLTYLRNTNDHYFTKRNAIFALSHYKDQRIKEYLSEEYEKNKNNEDTFFRRNYLDIIEDLLNKLS